MARTRVLLLTYDASALEAGLGVVCAAAGPVQSSAKEPVGHGFHHKQLLQAGVIGLTAEEDPPSSSGSDDADTTSTGGGAGLHGSASVSSGLGDDLQPPPGVSWKKSKAKKKQQLKQKDTDYYALLGLQHERWTATESQMKQAYRRVCLEHHPDKKLVGVECEEAKSKAEEYFKKIQEAYEVLSDPAKRREYDSTDDFDDTLPLDCSTDDFFKVFTPAFRRNARWSVAPTVPDLAGPEAAWEDVETFYDFWFAFKSWREFPHPDEEDVEGAESREHRRWIERLNSKLREKGKKEEGRRLREFVDAAYRLDPRVAAHRAAQVAERERKKAEKAAARQQQEEAQRRAKEEEEERKRAEEAAAKAAAAEAKARREVEKRAIKKERQRLRAAVAAGADGNRLLSEDDTERLCASLDAASLSSLSDAATAEGADADERRALLAAALARLELREAEEAADREAKKREAEVALKTMAKRDHERKVASMREWSDEELRLLDKAVKKFPMGTPRRWEQVAAYVRTRTLDEVLLMVKEHQGASSTRMKAQEDWKGAAKKRAEVTSEADLRCSAFTDVQVNLNDAAAMSASADSSATNSAAGSQRPSGAGGVSGGGDCAVAAPSVPPGSESTTGAAAAAGAAAGAAAAPAPTKPRKASAAVSTAADAAEGNVWSEEQELALVQALKRHGKELSDRWERVAAEVPGKGKSACFKRFKELREAFRAKKGGEDGG